jgi:acyl-CoA thioester hydrolase
MTINDATLPIRIYYEDTDAGGVVYYANYLKYFERARTEMLRQAGIHQQDLAHQHDTAFVVRRCTIDYHYPARLDDALMVMSTITKLGKARIVFEQRLVRGDTVLCHASVVIACLTLSSFSVQPIPPFIMDALT